MACAQPDQLGVWSGANGVGGDSCFVQGGADAPPGVLHIVVARTSGEIVQRGTAAIIRESGAAGGPPRILTAAHVVGPAIEVPAAHTLRMLLPNGYEVGTARVIALAEPWNAALLNDASRRDLAVLEMTSFRGPEAQAAYGALGGFALATGQRADSILRARFNVPAGMAPGGSGSPVLDRAGLLRGLVTKVQAAEGLRVVAQAGRITPGWGERISGALPISSLAVAEPISSSAILAALGAAAGHVQVGPRPGARSVFDATVPSFPQLRCIIYHATMAEVPLPPGPEAMARVAAAFRHGPL